MRKATAQEAEATAAQLGVQRVDGFTVETKVERRCHVVKLIVGTELHIQS